MAVYRFHINHLKVSSGRGAARVVQYLVREGQYAPKQDEVEYLTRTSQATTDRDDLVHQEAANLPGWAHGDAAGFFARAEQHERANGRYATTWQLALPKELALEEQVTMARDFLEAHLAGKPYLWVLHDPVNEQGDHQPHIHVMFSERTHDGIERSGPAHYFKQWDRRQPERGGCGKDRWFNQRNSVYEIRAAWCDWTNYTMERAGHEAHIHPSSLYKQGIDRKPEPKVGPSQDASLIAERDRIRQQRDTAMEQRKAAEGWEARKGKLGITDVHQIPPAQFAQDTMRRARNVQPGQWVPGMPSPQAQHQARQTRQHERREGEVRRLVAEIRILERRQGRVRLPRGHGQETDAIRNGLRANLREDLPYEQRVGYGR
ncbi:MAG TPA: MobA/MobL family protein [Candidatus Tectomicrobia bacterium]